jgi:hypothetical protein
MKSLEGRITVDFQESYFRRIPGFMRLADITFIHLPNPARRERNRAAVKLNMSPTRQ